MTTEAPAKPKRSRTKKTDPSPTSLPPDDADTTKDEVDSAIAKLREQLAATEKKLNSFSGWQKKLRTAMAAVTTARAQFEKADAARKEAKASVDTAVAKVLELDAKIANGEQLLPYDDPDAENDKQPVTKPATPVGNDHGAAEPIESMLAKNIRKIVGKEAFDAAKAKDAPIGLSEKQIEILTAKNVKTVGDLEKMMRENEWWHRDLKGFGEKNITRLVDTLLAFRAVYPVPAPPDSPATQPAEQKPPELQPEEWEQSAYHLRELISQGNAILESDINDDGKQFVRGVVIEAEDMLKSITEAKSVTPDQKTAIENWSNGVAKWRKGE